MAKNYSVRLRCPYGDHDAWVILEKRDETFEQISHASWDFECPTHGVQREIPLEASEKTAIAPTFAPGPQGPGEIGGQQRTGRTESSEKKRKRRSSERKSLYVPVVVYGWTKKQGSFHEETTTLLEKDSPEFADSRENSSFRKRKGPQRQPFHTELLHDRREQGRRASGWAGILGRFGRNHRGEAPLAREGALPRCLDRPDWHGAV